jgi:hypothetical protein
MLFVNESASPLKESLAYSLVSLFWVKTGKSSWVLFRTQGVVPIIVADDQMYYGYCINYLYSVMGDN